MVHEDTEIVTEEGTGDSELPCRSDDEQLTESNEDCGDDNVQRSGEDLDVWLFCDCFLEPGGKSIREVDEKGGNHAQAIPQHPGKKD